MQRPLVDSADRCLDCDYLLRDLTDPRCPECGRSFDPRDPTTVNRSGRRFPTWARLLVRPIGWPMHVLTLAPIVYTLFELRRPGGEFTASVFGLELWLVVAVILFACFIARHAVADAYARPRRTLRGHWSRWLVAPALLVTWFFLGNAEWPQRLALRVSASSLERLARGLLENPAAVTPPQRAGLLYVSSYERTPEGVRLFTGPGYDGVPSGYAYCPASPPPAEAGYRPMGGAWWEYWSSDERLAPAAMIVPPVTSGSTETPTKMP